MKPLAVQYNSMHESKPKLNELFGWKKLKKLIKGFKKFKKPKKSKTAFDAKKASKKSSGFFSKLAKKFKLSEASDEDKKKALAKHLVSKGIIDKEDELDDSHMEDYMVLTDGEADEQLKDYIRESVWAFNADFLINNGFGSQEDINKNLGLEDSYYDEDEEKDVEIGDAEEVFYVNMGMSLEEWVSDQQEKAEDANDAFMNLIDDFDSFVKDAESADGRGHFLSGYDGEENEVGDLYIYRTN